MDHSLRNSKRIFPVCPILILVLLLPFFNSVQAQLSVAKMFGKNSHNSTIGFGTFAFWDFPVNEIGNRSVMIELMDLAFFPQKKSDVDGVIGYLSIKAGYKIIFNMETKTGFYVEPSIGFCRVVNSAGPEGTHGDGVAIAAETGYTVEVGQRSNSLNFGLKYESDIAGSITSLSSLAFRFSYSFHMFRRRRDY